MAITVKPATSFEDVRTMVGPKKPTSNVCWCLSYRVPSKVHTKLSAKGRGDLVKELMEDPLPIGVLAYDGDEVVGWAAVAPRSRSTFETNRKIPHVDDQEAWSVWCLRVRPGHRKQGIAHELLDGAVEFAADNNAPVIEGYPVDNKGEKVDLTMAYVGTRALFEASGFSYAADTTSVINGFPRVVMRRGL